MDTFNNRIRSYRQSMPSMTQDQMAEILGVDRTTITYYEKKMPPKLPQCLHIANRLGVTMDWLTGYSDHNKWGNQVKQFRATLQERLPELMDIPLGVDRGRRILELMNKAEPPLCEKWFQAGILGLKTESYDEFLSDPSQELGPPSFMGLAELLGVSDMWLMLGSEYRGVMEIDHDLGDYLPIVWEFRERRLKPETLKKAMDYLQRYAQSIETVKATG